MDARVPDQSLEQRMDALARANEIRVYRAEVKRALKTYPVRRDALVELAWLICDTPPMMQTMKTVDLLMAGPGIGQSKVTRMLRLARVSPSKTLGGLTLRQRLELVGQLPHVMDGLPEKLMKELAA